MKKIMESRIKGLEDNNNKKTTPKNENNECKGNDHNKKGKTGETKENIPA